MYLCISKTAYDSTPLLIILILLIRKASDPFSDCPKSHVEESKR